MLSLSLSLPLSLLDSPAELVADSAEDESIETSSSETGALSSDLNAMVPLEDICGMRVLKVEVAAATYEAGTPSSYALPCDHCCRSN